MYGVVLVLLIEHNNFNIICLLFTCLPMLCSINLLVANSNDSTGANMHYAGHVSSYRGFE